MRRSYLTGIPLALQRLPAPARPGMGRPRARGAGALRRRRAGAVQVPAAGRGRACAAAGAAGRPWLGAKQAKTRIVHLQVGGEGCDFLGFEHRLVRHAPRRGGKPITYLARWPTNKAMQHARDRIRELTDRSRLWLHVGEIVGDLNRFLHAWATYLQVRQLDPALRQGQTLCAHAAGVVYQQTPSSQPRVWLVGGGSRLTRPTGSGRPDRDRRRSQTLPGLAGEAECRR